MTFKFSVVMAAYNAEKYIKESLDSIIKQSIGFKENIQIIVVNDASEDNTKSIVESYIKKYPDNIKLLNNETNKGPAFTRNRGLSEVEGEYVNFLDSDDYISKDTFEKVDEFFETHETIDMVSIPIYFFGYKRGNHPLNYKFAIDGIVNLFEKPNAIQLSAASSFFRQYKLEGRKFNENLKVSEDALLINQMLLRNPLYGVLSDCKYYYRKEEETSLITDSANNKSYFTTRVDEYFFRLIHDSLSMFDRVPEFIQNVIMYDLQWILEIDDISFLLNEDELKELYEKIFLLLFYIEDKVILNQKSIPSTLKAHIVLMKYFKWDYLNTKTFNIQNVGLEYLSNEMNLLPRTTKKALAFIIKRFAFNKVYIDNFEFKSPDELYVSGMITSLFNRELNVQAVVSDNDKKNTYRYREEIIDSKRLDFPQRANYSLNHDYGFNHSFEITIPIRYENTRISFRTDLKDLNQLCDDLGIRMSDEEGLLTKDDIEFGEDYYIDYNLTSRLSRTGDFKLSKDFISFDQGKSILVKRRSRFGFISNELATSLNIFSQKREGWRTGFVLRFLYLITYPFFRNKRIWILMDLPYSADDNGVQLFKYINKVNNLDKGEYAKFIDDLDLDMSNYPSKDRFGLRALNFYNGSSGFIIDLFRKIADLIIYLLSEFNSIIINQLEDEEEYKPVYIVEKESADEKLDSVPKSLDEDNNSSLDLKERLSEKTKEEKSQLNSDDKSSESEVKEKSELNSDDKSSEGEVEEKSRFKSIKSIKSIKLDDFNQESISNKLDSLDYGFTQERLLEKFDSLKVDLDDNQGYNEFVYKSSKVFNKVIRLIYRLLEKFISILDKIFEKFIGLLEKLFNKLGTVLTGFLDKGTHEARYMDLRKIKVYFTLEKSSSHYDNVVSLENEYMASSNMNKIKKLLGLDKSSKEYDEIKKIGKVLPYKSLKHRLYSMYAELIVSSHPDNNIIYPFWGNYPHLAGLVKSRTVFLQHGVTKDNVSSWLNSYDKNLALLLTVSEKERQSFLDYDYGYSEDVVKVLGFPRFDYLETLEDRREIIVMPTWRRQYHDFTDDEFKESTFYKTFNRLINDNDLLDYLEKHHYKLVFKPHPNLNRFIKLFDKDFRVEFDLHDLNNEYEGYTSRRYSDIFNHSSLIITDFSSVSFDFAYLKKPLIYYHYGNDYHFDSENGYFDYDEMGFGPVVKSHDDLIGNLKRYVDSNCRMEDIYRERVDDFFKYTDKENCKRVYKALVELNKYY